MRVLGRMSAMVLLVVPLLTAGCLSRAVKEGLGVAVGAKGSYQPITGVSAGDELAAVAYTNFELARLTDATGGRVPGAFWGYLPEEFNKELVAKKLPQQPGGRTLVARGSVIYYEDASLTGNVFGPLEEVVARIEFVDKASGRTVVQVFCVGRTKESVNLGVQKKAEGLAKAIVRWIHDHYPKEGRE